MAKNIANKDVPAGAAVSLATLFWIFLRIAFTSFGGFMAMISVVENVVVQRRKLLSGSDMLDGISLASILPGPMAVNVVAYVGYRLRGWAGATVCVFASILPAFLLMVLLSIAYFRWGQIPAVTKVFQGFVPAVVAIIAVTAWNMGRKAVTGVPQGVLAVAAAAALLAIGGFLTTLAIIVVAGIAGWLYFGSRVSNEVSSKNSRVPAAKRRRKRRRSTASVHLLSLGSPALAMVPLLSFDPGLLFKIFFVFAGMGLMLFGGAYVFIPVIQESVVNGYGWVTQQEFIDAVALSQIMPGPVLVSSAFIGLKIAGLAGAVAASTGIFLPAAILMVFCSHGLDRVKNSATVGAALKGIRPSAVGMIFAAALIVAKTVAAPLWVSALIFLVSLTALLRFRIEAYWLIPPAGLAGFLLY
ncbi:MAG TPA: chromate efflux transporter [Burkholderiales bacterium]|nr:chromate efflux transporter [Burkholderiales bacterium]